LRIKRVRRRVKRADQTFAVALTYWACADDPPGQDCGPARGRWSERQWKTQGACCGWHSIASAARRLLRFGSPWHRGTSRLPCFRIDRRHFFSTCAAVAALAPPWRREIARQHKIAWHDPADWHRELENDYACRGRPGAAAVCAKICATDVARLQAGVTSTRFDVDEIQGIPGMPQPADWKVLSAVQPRLRTTPTTSSGALSAVVAVHTIVPADAFSAETLAPSAPATAS